MARAQASNSEGTAATYPAALSGPSATTGAPWPKKGGPAPPQPRKRARAGGHQVGGQARGTPYGTPIGRAAWLGSASYPPGGEGLGGSGGTLPHFVPMVFGCCWVRSPLAPAWVGYRTVVAPSLVGVHGFLGLGCCAQCETPSPAKELSGTGVPFVEQIPAAVVLPGHLAALNPLHPSYTHDLLKPCDHWG